MAEIPTGVVQIAVEYRRLDRFPTVTIYKAVGDQEYGREFSGYPEARLPEKLWAAVKEILAAGR